MLSALGGGFAEAFMPRRPGAVQCCRGGGLGAARGADDLPALLLPPLRDANLHLCAVRLRELLLSWGVCRARSTGVCAPRGCSLPAHLSRSPQTRRTATALSRGAKVGSDASCLFTRGDRVQRIEASDNPE